MMWYFMDAFVKSLVLLLSLEIGYLDTEYLGSFLD